jgi:hypothetical protein
MTLVSIYAARRVPLAAVAAALTLLAIAVSSERAAASEPWWHVATISAPAGADSNEEARVDLDIANVGDAATEGTIAENKAEGLRGESRRFVKIVDQLPAGVTPLEAHAEGGELGERHEFEIEAALGRNLCSVAGQTVRCEYATPVRAYEQIIVAITVKVQAGAGAGENEASVSGGGAPAVRSRHRLTLEGPVSYGPQSWELVPEEEGGLPTTQAGSHPFQMTTALMLNTRTALVTKSSLPPYLEVEPPGLTKDLYFTLPPGLVGNPTPLPKCSMYTFLQSVSPAAKPPQCPNDTVVGVAEPIITNLHLLNRVTYVPYPTFYPLISLEPSVGEPARFGFGTPVGPVFVDTSVRPGNGYSVVGEVHNALSNTAFVGSVVTIWGVPADSRHDNSRNQACLGDTAPQEEPSGPPGAEPSCSANALAQPFLVMPTSCTSSLQTSVEADSWQQIGKFVGPLRYTFQNSLGEPYKLDGCNRLNFEPTIRVTPDGQEASTPTGLGVDVHVPQDASLTPTGLAESAVKETTVALPIGVGLNPAGADGLLSCGVLEVGLESSAEQLCPEASKVGTLEIRTPLLPHPLVGAAYIAAQEDNPFGSLLAMYLVAKDPVSGVITKLAGEVKPDLRSGQLLATFREVPELPFEDATIHFFGGSRAPLGTPALCGDYTTTASIAPWAENGAVSSESQFLITSGPNHTPCRDPLPFSPSLTTGSANLQAGAFTPFTMTMTREDGEQSLDGVQLRMPPGLSGLLTGVKLCGEAEANAGACGPESLIGETTVSVGLGGNPYTVKGGRVYLTGPYQGAPFGLSIVNPAKAGPFDLEHTARQHPACDCLVVRAKIEVDPTTAALTVTSDSSGPHSIPTMIEGIPLQIKHVNVTVNRPGFTFNPTNCQPMGIDASLTSDQGTVSATHVPFQVTNCATLAFKPRFQVSTSSRTSRSKGAGLNVKLSYPSAPWGSQANIHSVKVDLPKRLPSRLSTLQKACPDRVFGANPAACPPASRVGTASARTPLLPVPLNGPAYFVSHGGARFPELIVVLSGYGVTVDLRGETFINERTNVTSSTFRSVPDVPVGSFELTLPQGPDSALAAIGNLCAGSLKMPTVFTAQNGIKLKQNTPIAVTGCAKRKHHGHGLRHRRAHGRTRG